VVLSIGEKKEILESEPEKLKKIEIISASSVITLTHKGKEWQATSKSNSKTMDEKEINTFLKSLEQLVAHEFLSEEQIKQFKKEKTTTELKFYTESGSKPLVLKLLDKGNVWWAEIPGEEDLYVIPKFRLNRILLDPVELFKKEEPAKS